VGLIEPDSLLLLTARNAGVVAAAGDSADFLDFAVLSASLGSAVGMTLGGMIADADADAGTGTSAAGGALVGTGPAWVTGTGDGAGTCGGSAVEDCTRPLAGIAGAGVGAGTLTPESLGLLLGAGSLVTEEADAEVLLLVESPATAITFSLLSFASALVSASAVLAGPFFVPRCVVPPPPRRLLLLPPRPVRDRLPLRDPLLLPLALLLLLSLLLLVGCAFSFARLRSGWFSSSDMSEPAHTNDQLIKNDAIVAARGQQKRD
jgi:hypothetical protein